MKSVVEKVNDNYFGDIFAFSAKILTKYSANLFMRKPFMIVKDGWKLIIPYTKTSTVINAMYNLNEDPFEINNLLGKNLKRSEYEKQAEELRGYLLEWLKRNNSKHYDGVKERKLI